MVATKRPDGKRATQRGRKSPEDRRAAREKMSSESPRDWTATVAELTDSPTKQAALLQDLATLDEAETVVRTQLLAGSSTAGRVLGTLLQHRAKLLGLYAPTPAPLKPLEPLPPEEVDVLEWTCLEAPSVDNPPAHPDDADLNADLAAALEDDNAAG